VHVIPAVAEHYPDAIAPAPQIVGDIMSTEVITVREETTFKELFALMRRYHLKEFPVVDSDYHLKGMVYEKDVLNNLLVKTEDNTPDAARQTALEEAVEDAQGKCIQDIMTKEVLTTTPCVTIMQAGSQMLTHSINILPVVKDGRMVGMVSQGLIFMEIMRICGTPEASPETGTAAKPLSPNNIYSEPIVPSTQDPQRGEKRLYDRHRTNVVVAYKLNSISDPASTHKAGSLAQAQNVSIGGLLLITQGHLPEGAVLDLAFDLSDDNHPIRRMGRITRSVITQDPGQYEIGVMFLAMTVAEVNQIQSYLDKIPG